MYCAFWHFQMSWCTRLHLLMRALWSRPHATLGLCSWPGRRTPSPSWRWTRRWPTRCSLCSTSTATANACLSSVSALSVLQVLCVDHCHPFLTLLCVCVQWNFQMVVSVCTVRAQTLWSTRDLLQIANTRKRHKRLWMWVPTRLLTSLANANEVQHANASFCDVDLLLCNTKGDFLNLSSSKTYKKHHKSTPYYSCSILKVFSWRFDCLTWITDWKKLHRVKLLR